MVHKQSGKISYTFDLELWPSTKIVDKEIVEDKLCTRLVKLLRNLAVS